MTRQADTQLQTMVANMRDRTGRSLEEWYRVLDEHKLEKHGDILKLLKGEYGVSHGFANTISALFRERVSGGPPPEEDLVATQYAKKPALKPLYNRLLAEVQQFGNDIEIAPKKAYVSLRRARQFAIVQPSTRTRIDLGLNLKAVTPAGVLIEGDKWSGMCSHRIELTGEDEITTEVVDWLRLAYDQAG